MGRVAPVGCLLALCAAAPYRVSLDAASCRPATPELVATLGADWRELAAFAQDCPVPGQDGKAAIRVAVVRIDRMLAEHYFAAHEDSRIPLPVLLDGTGTAIGKLPEGFPADLPGMLRVTFEDWRGGMPLRIEQYEAFETALPPHALAPQTWDAANHRYVQAADAP